MFFRLLLPAALLLLSLANLGMGSQVTTNPNVPYTSTKPTLQVFQTMERKIGQNFAAVRVDRAKVGVAVAALGRANAHNFKNRLVNDQLKGVKGENFEGVAKFICSKLTLKDCTKVKNAFKLAILVDSSETKIEEFSFDRTGWGVYGFIMTKRNSQGDVDIVYTIHQQELRLSASGETSGESSEESMETTHSTPTRSTRPFRTTRPSNTTRVFRPTTATPFDPGFTSEEMEAIRSHYSKYEALLRLKQENVIQSINFV